MWLWPFLSPLLIVAAALMWQWLGWAALVLVWVAIAHYVYALVCPRSHHDPWGTRMDAD
jgi:hypothetical protein